jgi:hypothetical protein
MANTKISNLTSAGTLTGSEVAPIVQSGSTVKATAQNIANLAIPTQAGQGGKYLTTDGSTTSWGTVTAGQNFLTYAVQVDISGGVFNATDLYNDTGTTFTYSAGSSNGRMQINSATSAFTASKTIGFATNVRDQITGDIGILYQQANFVSQFRFQYVTPAGANFNFTSATCFTIMVLIQIYP